MKFHKYLNFVLILTLSVTLVSSAFALGYSLLSDPAGYDVGSATKYWDELFVQRPKVKSGTNAKYDTFTCNGATGVDVANTSITALSHIDIALKTVGGTVGAQPTIQTITPSTGFNIKCTASDTSIYSYVVTEAF